ncbi:MAG TPA: M56 family metallopeptidase, partial [Longimicrobium sp.]|nr:M56 family metallopeptidase [Longimicrobium sp.]
MASAALIVAKSTLLLCTAALAARALRRGSAAARHLVWCLALGGAMALPALALVVPGWKPAFLAVLRPAGAAWGIVPASRALPPLSLAVALAVVWAAGAAVVLARLALALRAASRLARHAETVEDPEWTGLLERLGQAMEVGRPVTLLRSAEAAMPLTWGALRPAILLPAEADAWPEERRRVVLLHELAHVARRDCLVQTLAMVCCAAYWFHPGAWWAARKMREEREQACDDRVLAAGARASDYAGHLLDVARAYRAPLSAAAIAMAAPSQLEGRVRAVLEPRRDRRAVTRRTGAVCAGAVLLASLPLAAVAPSERAPAARPEMAWELPPARSVPSPASSAVPSRLPAPEAGARPGMRIVASVRRAPRSALPARTADHPSVPRLVHAAQATRRTDETTRPAVFASIDADGGVHVNLKALRAARSGRPLRVRVEGHGTTSAATVDIRVDPRLQAMVAQVAATGSMPAPYSRIGPGRLARKFDAIVRSAAASGGGSDLAVRVLDELNAGLSRAA